LSVEQGRLVAHLRARVGEAAATQQASARECLALLDACCGSLRASRAREASWERKHAVALAHAAAAASAREAHLQRQVQDGAWALQRQKEDAAREAAEHLHALRALQAMLADLQGDGQSRDSVDLRQQLKRSEQQRNALEQQLEQLQPIREKASEARVLALRLAAAMADVGRLQEELAKRDVQLAGALDGSADQSFAAAAGAATSGERAVVLLACLDPLVDADRLLPAAKPKPGTLLCVRCEKSLNQV
jgi:chromosome segregation ATPase